MEVSTLLYSLPPAFASSLNNHALPSAPFAGFPWEMLRVTSSFSCPRHLLDFFQPHPLAGESCGSCVWHQAGSVAEELSQEHQALRMLTQQGALCSSLCSPPWQCNPHPLLPGVQIPQVCSGAKHPISRLTPPLLKVTVPRHSRTLSLPPADPLLSLSVPSRQPGADQVPQSSGAGFSQAQQNDASSPRAGRAPRRADVTERPVGPVALRLAQRQWLVAPAVSLLPKDERWHVDLAQPHRVCPAPAVHGL